MDDIGRLRHTFNTLPPKPEYLAKVLSALSKDSELSEKDLVLRTGLTKTQALCALIELVKNKKVTKSEDTKRYSIALPKE